MNQKRLCFHPYCSASLSSQNIWEPRRNQNGHLMGIPAWSVLQLRRRVCKINKHAGAVCGGPLEEQQLNLRHEPNHRRGSAICYWDSTAKAEITGGLVCLWIPCGDPCL